MNSSYRSGSSGKLEYGLVLALVAAVFIGSLIVTQKGFHQVAVRVQPSPETTVVK